MRSIGLKLNITGTLVLLLTTAVLLGNAVIVLLWHRGLLNAEVQHLQTVAGLWREMAIRTEKSMVVSPGALDNFCRAVGNSCLGAAYSDGNSTISAGSTESLPALEDATRLAAASRTQVVRFSETSFGGFLFGEKRLFAAFPVSLSNRENMGLGLMITTQTASQIFQKHLKIVIIYMLVNIVLLTIIGLFRMVNIVVRPIERLVKTSEAYDYADGLAFLGEQKGSEIGQLSLALNRMVARIEDDRQKLRDSVKSLEQANSQLIATQKEMIRAEKLAAVGRLSAGLAHEIGNPIGIVQGYLELLENADLSSEDRMQFSRRAIDELQRINNLIHQLLDFSRSSSQEAESVAVQDILSDVVAMFAAQKNAPEIKLVQDCTGQDDLVLANAIELRQVFLNCLLNAADSIQEKGRDFKGMITVNCRCIDEEKPLVMVEIADNGKGIDPRHLDMVFDPFFTTKAPGKGTGLGLSVSYSIIEAAGGRIWAESVPESGASIKIELPATGKNRVQRLK